MAFHLGLLFFGWWLWLYAVPILGALSLLLRAELRHEPQQAMPSRHDSCGNLLRWEPDQFQAAAQDSSARGGP
jgi:hypothetical protein